MLTRRQALYRTARAGAAAALATFPDSAQATPDAGVLVNDVHSQLNETRVGALLRPKSLDDLQAAVRQARRRDSIAGSRHAMGGQQFRTEGLLVDMTGFNQVLRFDRERGLIEVEAGIEWPELFGWLAHKQQGLPAQWGIRQKQTGADRLSLGGALAANIHGRGLSMKPIIDDVESFTLIDADGELRICSRRENSELFSLAIGGYGIVAHVTLRLAATPVRRFAHNSTSGAGSRVALRASRTTLARGSAPWPINLCGFSRAHSPSPDRTLSGSAAPTISGCWHSAGPDGRMGARTRDAAECATWNAHRWSRIFRTTLRTSSTRCASRC